MSLIAVAQHVRRPRMPVRTLLVVIAVTAGIIVGLLAMHSLNLHVSPTGHGPVATDTVMTGPASAHHEPAAGAVFGAGGEAAECVDCGDDHTMAWMACVLGLLATVVLLARSGRGWRTSVIGDDSRAAAPRWPTRAKMSPPRPSLTVLCISRT